MASATRQVCEKCGLNGCYGGAGHRASRPPVFEPETIRSNEENLEINKGEPYNRLSYPLGIERKSNKYTEGGVMGSILRKVTCISCLILMGFFFQNCSEGDGGSGGDSGSNPVEVSNPIEDSGPSCPSNFVMVPGNEFYGTTDFCVMKYEAKAVNRWDENEHSPHGCTDPDCSEFHILPSADYRASSVAANRPWVRIKRAEAAQACRDSGYELITNDQWQTIARNIENVGKNWNDGQVGNTGLLNHGHSDNAPNHSLPATSDDNDPCFLTGQDCDHESWNGQKRTHIILNGDKEEIIWDIAGNVWEWVKDNNGTWDEDNDSGSGASNYGIGSSTYISQLPIDSTVTDSLTSDSSGTARTAKDQFGPSRDYSALNSGDHGWPWLF